MYLFVISVYLVFLVYQISDKLYLKFKKYILKILRDYPWPGGVLADLDGGPGHVRAPRHNAAHGETALVQCPARAARPRPGTRL